MSSTKKYGLVLPEKAKANTPVFQASRNVFGDDSESDDDNNKKPILLRPSDNINRQAKNIQNKAINEDPTIFQYDEVYDTMKNEKEDNKVKQKEDKKPRYIENLLKTANKRKIENERRVERQIQKERELEGDEFADKEVFVTSAYKKKLEELSLEEEKEKREEYLEKIGEVTKQRDLGGFYRHLYEQKLGSEKPEKTEAKSVNTSNKSDTDSKATNSTDKADASKTRNYRKRKSSDAKKNLSEGEIEDSEEEINRLNLNDIRMAKKNRLGNENIDADSDFSIDESSDEENAGQKGDKEDSNVFKKPAPQVYAGKISKTETDLDKQNTVLQNSDSNMNDSSQKEKRDIIDVKIKVNIWEKRTVGEVFEQALKRYYERKASRGM